ncbi:MAG: TonB family protein, partial [Balneolaceae bacterium]|nr:TonB family protein [Balneolaceae bacterium]
EARQKSIEGRVYVQFIVNEQGDVEDAKVIRGIGGGADEEALRVVRQAKFEPGMQRGRPVRVQYSLPIFFRLDGTGNNNNIPSPQPPTNSENETTVIGYQQSEPIIEEPEINYNMMEVKVDRSGNSIEGTVMNSKSGEPLPGANIIIQGTNTGTVSDENGRFHISNAEKENSQIMVSYIGFRTVQVNL